MILSNLRAIAESTERITTTLDAGNEPSEPIDIAAGQERVLNRLLVVLLVISLVSIAFFFVCLFGYRYAMANGRDL